MKFLGKKSSIVIGLIIILFCLVGWVICKNVPLRTQIYRSICKGNWNLLADGDTVYASGYCGIRKYFIDNNGSVTLLQENESFAKNRIIGHGLAITKDRIFLACRSYLAGPQVNDKAKYEGELIVLDRDLNKRSEYFLPSKMNDAESRDSMLVLTGINRFYVFDVSKPDFPKLLFEHKSQSYTEYQGCAVWKDKGRMFVAITLFSAGIDIWDITNAEASFFVKNIKLSEVCKGNQYLQTLDILSDYPYLYATVAPTSNAYFKDEDMRGVMELDVSNMDSIKTCFFGIPRKDYWKPMAGDSHPKSISLHNKKLYLSAATKGVAIFEKQKDGLAYKGLNQISSEWDQIYPIAVTGSGRLVSGDWNWNSIHVNNE